MTHAEMRRAALDFANHLRELQEARPLSRLRKGWQQDTAACPIARTANIAPSGREWSIGPVAARLDANGELTHRVVVPEAAREFMAAFDAGEFPTLLDPVGALG